MAQDYLTASGRKTTGHTVSPHRIRTVCLTPDCMNGSVDQAVERELADSLGYLRLRAVYFSKSSNQSQELFSVK
jgi:hypothetical protein